MSLALDKLFEEVKHLKVNEQLELLEKIIHNIKEMNSDKDTYLDWNKLYGLGKDIWSDVDAQDYVNELREDR